jgi:prepilin-type N-terminal cleavage/methylation domain-containing protein
MKTSKAIFCSRNRPKFPLTLRSARAFSLMELLAAAAIICLLAVLAIPSLTPLLGSTGRKGAVISVMNTLEQSRVAALEKGRDVFVLFWRREGAEADAMVVLQKNEADTEWEPLSRWIELPDGVLFYKPADEDSVFSEDTDLLASQSISPTELPGHPTSTDLDDIGGIRFNSNGGVAHPDDSSQMVVALTEGVRDSADGNDEILSAQKKINGGFEVITIARYTGRSTLEMSSL